MKDLGDLKYFLGIKVLRSASGIILNQRKYILELIADTGLSGSKPAITPLESNAKLTSIEYDHATGAQDDELLSDISSYQRLIGKLMYATITRPDITFFVQTLSQFMQHPKKSHWEEATRVLRYLKGFVGQGIWFKAKPDASLTCWCDSNWATYPNTRRSVTGYTIHFATLQSEVAKRVVIPVKPLTYLYIEPRVVWDEEKVSQIIVNEDLEYAVVGKYVLIRAARMEDYVNLLSKPILHIAHRNWNYPMRTLKWDPLFDPQEETSIAIVWISLPALPPNFFGKKKIISSSSWQALTN
ncbi:uncharacterized mitochondrial protein AtMg00810-like [Capsicum annuum]|uniref:uncharacterized mitochondrial protein AtMg00810-like n=1 Tax=Capsicum annuum TaxID=4072 RepID=UPI001FB14B77|nr:uncharacterized mitochondrial protein AtMg00810-like [Capsicum annuum]